MTLSFLHNIRQLEDGCSCRRKKGGKGNRIIEVIALKIRTSIIGTLALSNFPGLFVVTGTRKDFYHKNFIIVLISQCADIHTQIRLY